MKRTTLGITALAISFIGMAALGFTQRDLAQTGGPRPDVSSYSLMSLSGPTPVPTRTNPSDPTPTQSPYQNPSDPKPKRSPYKNPSDPKPAPSPGKNPSDPTPAPSPYKNPSDPSAGSY